MWGGAPVARGRKSAAGFLLTGCSRPNRPRAGPWGGSGRHATREQATARLGLSPALILTNAHRGARTCTCASHRARESAGGAGLAHMLAHPVPDRGGASSEYGGDIAGSHWRWRPLNLLNSKAKRRGASGTLCRARRRGVYVWRLRTVLRVSGRTRIYVRGEAHEPHEALPAGVVATQRLDLAHRLA